MYASLRGKRQTVLCALALTASASTLGTFLQSFTKSLPVDQVYDKPGHLRRMQSFMAQCQA